MVTAGDPPWLQNPPFCFRWIRLNPEFHLCVPKGATNFTCFFSDILQEEQSLYFLTFLQNINLGQPRMTFPSPFCVAGVGRSIATCFLNLHVFKAFGGWKCERGTAKLHARILRGKGVQKKKTVKPNKRRFGPTSVLRKWRWKKVSYPHVPRFLAGFAIYRAGSMIMHSSTIVHHWGLRGFCFPVVLQFLNGKFHSEVRARLRVMLTV